MKMKISEISPGEFFEYTDEADGGSKMLFQKLAPDQNYNAVNLHKGQLCNLYENTALFEKVTLTITVEREYQ
jgi:hypothetical protein